MVVIIPNQLRIMSNGGGCGDYILNLLPLNSLKAASAAAAVDCGLWFVEENGNIWDRGLSRSTKEFKPPG